MAKLLYLNSKDKHGMASPNQEIGKVYLHLASNRLYKIKSYTLNASSDCWALRYAPLSEDPRDTLKCDFTRDMVEFMDKTRFLEVR